MNKDKIVNGYYQTNITTSRGENSTYTTEYAIDKLQQENKQLKEEIKKLELTVGLRQKRNLIRKFDKEYDEEDKKKKPDRDYACIMPDAEEVYKRYYKQKEVIEEVKKSLENYQEYIDEAKEFYSDLEDDDVVKVSNLQILNNQMVKNYDLLQILDKVKGE